MRDLKIRTKMLACFLVVAILAIVAGAGGVFGLITLSNNETYLYEELLMSVYYSTELQANFNQQRVITRNMALNIDDATQIAALRRSLEEHEQQFDDLFNKYERLLSGRTRNGSAAQLLRNLSTYYSDYATYKAELHDAVESQSFARANQVFVDVMQTGDNVLNTFEELITANVAAAQQTQERDVTTARTLIAVMAGLTVLLTGTAIVLGLKLSQWIAKPIDKLVEAASRLSIGDADIQVDVSGHDEPGMLAEAFRGMVEGIRQQAQCMENIAQGDYTVSVPVRSEYDMMNKAINTMVTTNNEMLSEVSISAQQVTFGAQQIALGAQNLASGTGEQAASIEMFSASITEVHRQVEENAEYATDALNDTNQVRGLMEESIASMGEMLSSMDAIKKSSHNITKVIKTIDDIAFQTNILALNAAVEAARAGQHGKGFAVVADEVRNLASKSAAAAKETAELIKGSVRLVEEGSEIVRRTNESFQQVNEFSERNTQAIQKISSATQTQTDAISDLNKSMSQVAIIVQSNSATAEESAASAEQMAAQADMLNSIVGRFKLKIKPTPLVENMGIAMDPRSAAQRESTKAPAHPSSPVPASPRPPEPMEPASSLDGTPSIPIQPEAKSFALSGAGSYDTDKY